MQFFALLLLTILVIAGGVSMGAKLTGLQSDQTAARLSETGTEEELSDDDEDGETVSDGAASDDAVNVVAVVKKAMPTVVAITNKSVQEVTYMFRGTVEMESESTGSGIIIGQNDTELLIATNYHVIENASVLTVCFSVDVENGEDAIAEAVEKGSDEEYDLAVIAVKLETISDEVMEQLDSAVLGSSEELVIGEAAIAIGNALGYGQSVTLGIVSALNRSVEIDGEIRNYIQTDAAINAGNSGGALLNADGEVIGINSAKVSASGVEGMGYAIPIDEAKPVLYTLMEQETREKADEDEQGYLGIYTQDVSTEARSLYDIPSGAYVTYVAPDSPAENAGIQSGDIISKLDDITVSSASGFENLLEYYRAGDTVTVEIFWSDKGSYTSQTLDVTFGDKPEEDDDQAARNTSPFESAGPFMR